MGVKIFDFIYAMFWLFLGAVIVVEQGFSSYIVGLGAFSSLIMGHLIKVAIIAAVDYSGIGK